MYLCVKGIGLPLSSIFISRHDIAEILLKVALNTKKTKKKTNQINPFLYLILELFQQCGIFGFHFIILLFPDLFCFICLLNKYKTFKWQSTFFCCSDNFNDYGGTRIPHTMVSVLRFTALGHACCIFKPFLYTLDILLINICEWSK